MRTRVLLLGLTLSGVPGPFPAKAVEITATGLSAPFFNAAGVLTHRIIAQQGTKAGGVRKLRGVEVQYVSADDPTVIVQRLETDEAEWDERKGTLVGGGRIAVTTPESRLGGEGFDFTLATSRLHVHRDFSLSNHEVLLTSDRAAVDVVVEKAGDNLKVRDVRRCEASGHLEITVQPSAVGTYGFEKAWSEVAIYDGIARTIELPQPTRTISKGLTATVKTTLIRLEPSGKPR